MPKQNTHEKKKHTKQQPKMKQSSECMQIYRAFNKIIKTRENANKLRTTQKENDTRKTNTKINLMDKCLRIQQKFSDIISLNCSLQNDFENHWHESSHILVISANDAPTSKNYTEICRDWPDSYVCVCCIFICNFCVRVFCAHQKWTEYNKLKNKRKKFNVYLAFSVYSTESIMHIQY